MDKLRLENTTAGCPSYGVFPSCDWVFTAFLEVSDRQGDEGVFIGEVNKRMRIALGL